MSLKKILDLKGTLLFRLTLLYAGIFVISSLFILSVFYFKIRTVTMENMDKELLKEAREYSVIMSERGIEGIKTKITVEGEAEDPDEEFFRLITINGETIVSTDTSSWGTLYRGDNLAQIQSGKTDHVFHTLNIPGREFKARMVSAVLSPDVVLQIGDTFENAENYLQIFRNWFLVLLFPVTAIAAIVGWFMAKRALLDMEDVTRTAHEISKGAYDRRVQGIDRFDEIKRLGDTFNNMLDRIETLLRSMIEVNDNIAHDLRSPLTRIRGIAEMSLMNEGSIDEYKSMAASTIEECDRLIDMINTMLEITEIESGISEPQIEELDVVKVIRNACELFRPIADGNKIDIMEDLPENMNFRGDRKKLQRIISNLLDNAIKYTHEGGTVTISAKTEEERIDIIFEDTGAGISETDIPHIFERFYRCDRSRSLDGIGLGLSLVKAFTEAMNGTISVISAVNKGSRFTVTFFQ